MSCYSTVPTVEGQDETVKNQSLLLTAKNKFVICKILFSPPKHYKIIYLPNNFIYSLAKYLLIVEIRVVNLA